MNWKAHHPLPGFGKRRRALKEGIKAVYNSPASQSAKAKLKAARSKPGYKSRKLAILAGVGSAFAFYFLLRIRIWWLAAAFGWIVYKIVRNAIVSPKPAGAQSHTARAAATAKPAAARPAAEAAAEPAPEAAAPARPAPVKQAISPVRVVLSAALGAVTVGIAYVLADYGMFWSLASGAAVCFGLIAGIGRPLSPPAPEPEAAAGSAKTAPGGAPGLTDEQRAALADAHHQIIDIELANADIQNAEFSARLDRIVASARGTLDLLTQRPEVLGRARKFLEVYLTGARQVIEKYAETHRFAQSDELEVRFQRLLATIEASFEEQRRALLEDDVLELDIAIEVLQQQLQQEGIA